MEIDQKAQAAVSQQQELRALTSEETRAEFGGYPTPYSYRPHRLASWAGVLSPDPE
jgi:hypothetical protein